MAGCAMGLVLKMCRAKKEACSISLDASALCPCLTLHLISHYLMWDCHHLVARRLAGQIFHKCGLQITSRGHYWMSQSDGAGCSYSFTNWIMWPHSGFMSTKSLIDTKGVGSSTGILNELLMSTWHMVLVTALSGQRWLAKGYKYSPFTMMGDRGRTEWSTKGFGLKLQLLFLAASMIRSTFDILNSGLCALMLPGPVQTS